MSGAPIYLGIDPGASGAIAEIRPDEAPVVWPLRDRTPLDIAALLATYEPGEVRGAALEQVHAGVFAGRGSRAGIDDTCPACGQSRGRPRMGAVSAFSFGESYGILRGCLAGAGIPHVVVLPSKWLRAVGVASVKGSSKTDRKNRNKQRAQELYPRVVVGDSGKASRPTHATADAVLIGHYAMLEGGR